MDLVNVVIDLLQTEYFPWPGTMIVLDGRGANAEFLRGNLQRQWNYQYFRATDQHFFHLLDEPWGRYSQSLIDRANGLTLDVFFDKLSRVFD